jgi:hypothetical protein
MGLRAHVLKDNALILRPARPTPALGSGSGSGGGQPRNSWVRRCRSRTCVSPAATPQWRGWRGEPGVDRDGAGGDRRGRASCADTGYPQTRFDAGTLAAAELLRRVGHGDIAEMGVLLAQAVPPVAASVMLAAGPELTGRVVTYRWPAGGPPDELLGPSGQRFELGAETARPSACQRCGKPLHTDGSRGGRPARYCSGACRTAAHRARHRTALDIPG